MKPKSTNKRNWRDGKNYRINVTLPEELFRRVEAEAKLRTLENGTFVRMVLVERLQAQK